MRNRKRRRAQEGQALLVVLVAVALLSLIGTAMTALWVRGVTLAQRRADDTTALYAAEAGLAEGLARIFSGNQAFLQGQGQLTGRVGAGAYQVSAMSVGQNSHVIAVVSTGWPVARPSIRRTVRLVVDSPFFRPVVAREDLSLQRTFCIPALGCWSWPFSATFQPSAAYGGKLTAGQDTTGVERGTLGMPALSYAAVAAKVPTVRDPIQLSSENCYIGMSGWYKLGKKGCASLTVAAPWVGVIGNLDLDRVTVHSGSVLVTTGDLVVTNIAFAQAQAVSGGGVVVTGGRIDITTFDVVQWGGGGAITLLALDTNTPDCLSTIPGCTYDPSHPDWGKDPSNSISIGAFSLISGSRSAQLVAFAAPYRVPPANEPKPAISINVGSLAQIGETTFRGTLVSGGDVIVQDLSGISLTSWAFKADPTLLGPLFQLASTVPQSGVLTQISWSEEGGGAP